MAIRWQLSDQALEPEGPIGVGIVNVTEDSMFEGARSGTPEQAAHQLAERDHSGLGGVGAQRRTH